MPKENIKPCNLTEDEWALMLHVFDEYCNDCDNETYEELREIHMKVFFMNQLVKEME
jgi:hypothetical protein